MFRVFVLVVVCMVFFIWLRICVLFSIIELSLLVMWNVWCIVSDCLSEYIWGVSLLGLMLWCCVS